MGTRSTYRVIQKQTHIDGKTKKVQEEALVLIYLQYDGYPQGHPSSVAEFLSKAKIVNGIPSDLMEDTFTFNGAGCLAARLVAELKGNTAGGTYLYPLTHRGHLWEDYMYDIIVDEDKQKITFKCFAYEGKKLFSGNPKDFVSFVSQYTND